MAGDVGPCSAWPSRSVAQISPSTRLVGDDQRLGRPGEEIDADAAEQLPLGLGDIGIAGPDDHVDRRDGLGAERHGGDRLHAAEHEDLVGAAEMHGRDDCRMQARRGTAARRR